MADISHKGFWIRWGSLGALDKILFASGMSLAMVGGGLMGFLMGLRDGGGQAAAQTVFGTSSWVLGPASFATLLAGLAIYAAFVIRQDELFRRLNELSVLWGGIGLLFATVLAISFEAVGWNWPSHEHVLLFGLIAGAAGYLYHYRKLY